MQYKKYMLILPRYNDIFGYFTAISLYRESRYNDTPIKRSNSTALLAYRFIGVPLYSWNTQIHYTNTTYINAVTWNLTQNQFN